MNSKEKIRVKRIFNLIAPIYFVLDNSLKSGYNYATKILGDEINLSGKSILDIGSGTGAWGAAILDNGAEFVQGVDVAEKMIAVAKKKRNGLNMKFNIADALNLNQFEDNSFDIATASFVLHGFKKNDREKILKEMKRVSKEAVVLHDYSGLTSKFARFLEYLEKSDYKNFKKSICDELKLVFNKVYKKELSSGKALYFSYIIN